ncbi:hypothetical protein NKG94_13655 [Micromonospora sp. M12]
MTDVRAWSEQSGVLVLPGGATVRGRRISAATSPADFAVLLAPARSRPGRIAGSGGPTSGYRSIGRMPSTPYGRRCGGRTTVNASRWPVAAGWAHRNGPCRADDSRRSAGRAGGAVGSGRLPPEGGGDPWQRRWLRRVS